MSFCHFFKSIAILIVFAIFIAKYSETKSISNELHSEIHSDVIVTKWPDQKVEPKMENLTFSEEKQPGWMKNQLLRFGKVASNIGNAMGTHASKITTAVDKVCEIVKTIIPLLAAICHVGQFKFCAATNDAPVQLAEAISPSMLNLNEPDK